MFYFPFLNKAYDQKQQPEHDKIYAKDIHNPAIEFSPELYMLMLLILKDGLLKKTFFDMLCKIYPYVDEVDKCTIEKLLNVQAMLNNKDFHKFDKFSVEMGKAERYSTIINILCNYASPQTIGMLNSLKQMSFARHEMDRLYDKISYYKNANKKGNTFDLFEMLLPPDKRDQFKMLFSSLNMFPKNASPDQILNMLRK
ncbi:MAG: hypothetical protein R2876_05055 [Eubacteriales bacterium]